jgi:arginine deiminase
MAEKAQRDFDSLQTTFQDKDIIIARLERDLQSVISSQHAASAQLSSQLREQREAVGQVVSGCASREALVATHAQVQRTEQSLAELATEHLVTKKQAALAAQFIAWYGNKQNEKVSVVG